MGRINRYDAIVTSLLQWGVEELRDLPWRRTREPWHILVSEVMLQQTSVERVLPKYDAFIEHFPTPKDLADASLGEALTLWSGLGYPRRCRHLHSTARFICDHYNGLVPGALDELLALPGIGQYTARAVQCFAFGDVVGVVDTNVSRVLSRIEGEAMSAKQLQELADQCVPSDSAWEWNQVLMDFGARHCTARAPQCVSCPLHKHCRWKGQGEDPALSSAGVSKPQARFVGSDRQARGLAMKAVLDGPQTMNQLVEAMQLANDKKRAQRLVANLVDEGLLSRRGQTISLP